MIGDVLVNEIQEGEEHKDHDGPANDEQGPAGPAVGEDLSETMEGKQAHQ
jgi:hypothetical protein